MPTSGRGLRAPFPRGAHSPRKPLVGNARTENEGGNCQIIGSFHHLADNSPPNPAHLMISSRNAEPKDQVKLARVPEMFSPSPTPPLPDDENHPISGRTPPRINDAPAGRRPKSGGPAFPPPLPASSRVKPPCFLMKNPCNALARSHEFWYHSTGCAKDGAIGNKCDDTRRRCICALRSLATATLQSYRMQLFRIRRSECTQS